MGNAASGRVRAAMAFWSHPPRTSKAVLFVSNIRFSREDL